MEIGDRILHIHTEEPGFIHDRNKRRVPMVEIRWEKTSEMQWLPEEMVRPYDKLIPVEPQKPTRRRYLKRGKEKFVPTLEMIEEFKRLKARQDAEEASEKIWALSGKRTNRNKQRVQAVYNGFLKKNQQKKGTRTPVSRSLADRAPQAPRSGMNTKFDYLVRTDGGCEPNPGGDMSAACLIRKHDGTEIYRNSRFYPETPQNSNNTAEFYGLLLALEWIEKNLGEERILVVSDSKILVGRMQAGSVPGGLCAKVAFECRAMSSLIPNIRYYWQPREKNAECDEMCQVELQNGRLRQRKGPPAEMGQCGKS